jgi:cytoskeleton protein RodZ
MRIPAEVKANAAGNRAWLTVSVTDKAWVQVKDKSGAVLFEKMLTANSSDKLEAQPPLFVWLGNAKATTLDYMGQSVDVASKTFNNTARLTLE